MRSLAAALPADLRAAVFVVLHIGAHKSELPWLLNQQGKLRAIHPSDGDPVAWAAAGLLAAGLGIAVATRRRRDLRTRCVTSADADA